MPIDWAVFEICTVFAPDARASFSNPVVESTTASIPENIAADSNPSPSVSVKDSVPDTPENEIVSSALAPARVDFFEVKSSRELKLDVVAMVFCLFWYWD